MRNRREKASDIVAEIVEIAMRRMSPREMSIKLEGYHEKDIAAAFDGLRPIDRRFLYRALSASTLAEILAYSESSVSYIEEMNQVTAARVISRMEPDSASGIFRELGKEKGELLLSLLDAEAREAIDQLLAYDDDTVGGRMSSAFVSVPSELSVRDAIAALIREAERHDNLSVLYTFDETGKYDGALSLRELLLADRAEKLSAIVLRSFPCVYADESIDVCIEVLREYSEESIPVLSENNEQVGVICAADFLEILDEERGDDYARLAGLSGDEAKRESFLSGISARLPWLALLFVLGLFVSSVVGLFEGVLASLPLIVCFQSLILGMAGNTGTQSLAVTIRRLSEHPLSSRDKRKIIFRELRLGLANGVLLSLLAFAGIGGYLFLFKDVILFSAFAVSGCIGFSLVIAMLVSSAVGTLVPLTLSKLGIDPAVASGPLITTVNDLVAVCVYYGLASLTLLNSGLIM